MPAAAVECQAIQMNDEMAENGAPDPQESNPVDSVKGKVQTLLENTPIDFGAWTLLLSEVEKTSPNDIQRICLVYDAFLSEFPLCYGYWKKYASHKARLCTLYEVEELYEQALKIATYSVDLWVSYCSFAMLSYEDPADIRRLYERALSFVGKDYLCHLLWDKYIEFEYSQKQWSRLAHIYINTLRFPIKKLHSYYGSFKKLVATLAEEIECQKDTEVLSEFVSNCGTEKVKDCGYKEISNVIRDLLGQQDGLPRPNAVKKYLTIGELFYQRSNELDRKISYFEARIRRPYFHVKPLDDCQLENWHQYLDFVEMQGNFDWTVKLYERCLIPCANYSEFWIRYVEFVDAMGGREIAKYALDRALTVFLKHVPAFHAYCAIFKEQIGDVCGARTLFLRNVIDSTPEFIENVNREANMEKRMGNMDAACIIYEKAIEMAKEKHVLQILPVLYTNFAQFTFLARGSIDAAREVFVKGIQQTPSRSILERLIQFITMHGGAGQIPNLDSIVVNAMAPESDVSKALSSQDREDISKLFLEFVELYGTIHDIRKAWDRHRKLFPHIMRPSFNFTIPEKNTLEKSKVGRDQMLVSPSHHVCGDKSHGGSDKHLMDDPQLKNSTDILCEGVIIHKLPPEEDKTGTKEIEEQVVLAEVKEQSIPGGTELYGEVNELAHECPDVAENPGVLPEPEVENQVNALPDHESSVDLRPPALDSLSINSPDTHAQQQSNPITLNEHGVCQELTSVLDGNRVPNEHNVHQESTSILDKDREQDGGNADKVSGVHEPSLQDMKSTPSQANLENVDSPLHPASDLDPSEAEINSPLQMQGQSETSSHQGSPASGACPQNSSSAGNGAQMHYGRHASEDSSTSSHGCVQASHSQQWQGLAQLQCSPAATKSQTLIIPGHPSPPQALSSAQDQRANQTQGQYQMAATQAYSTGNLAWPGQNIQQQGFVYVKTQLGTHAASQPQSEVYQQSVQTNEQYRQSQSYQGFAPHIWQYYQQHLYYLQQQQLQQKNSQQQHPENQVLLQIQQKSQNQQESQQHLPTEQNQSLELQQQQQASQVQQQNAQMHHTQQQQQQLYMQQQQQLYLQQHQQQLYLQQQLLQQQLLQQQQQQQEYEQQAQQITVQQQQQAQQLQQQQQPQLLQQQQQPQLLQQQQQQPHLLQQQQQQELLQQQQQQQLLLLQQQQLYQLQLQQQRQQISASELQALNISYYLQSLPVQYGNYQQRQDPGLEAETSQGEGADLQTAEQSGSSYPSTPQQGATNQ